jgi:hypothetical protein
MRHNPELFEDADQLTAPPAIENADVFGDIPSPIWIAFLSSWALLFGLFVLFFTSTGRGMLDVLTACFFAMMTLGLPAALGSRSRHVSRPWPRVIMTHSGSLPTAAAATQILLIPVGAVIGLIGFIVLAL